MVKAFRTIKPETVKEALKDSKMWERYREKPGETSLSGIHYNYKYVTKFNSFLKFLALYESKSNRFFPSFFRKVGRLPFNYRLVV